MKPLTEHEVPVCSLALRKPFPCIQLLSLERIVQGRDDILLLLAGDH